VSDEAQPEVTEIRLDKLVSQRFKLSRRAAQEAILKGRIDLEGFLCEEPGKMVSPSAELIYNVNRPKARRVIDSPIQVLYDDSYLVVLQKPPGVATTPSGDWESDTIVSRVERYFAIRHGGQEPYVGVVHRLDRDTSGVMIFAKNPEITRKLQETWRAHEIGREYLAIVMDAPPKDSIVCRRDVVETGERRRRLARQGEAGQSAVTHIELIEILSRRGALVRCIPETGRTHQIRLHLNSIGCPVFGDELYGRKVRNDQVKPPRLCLHAARLQFRHPVTGLEMEFDTQLPDDMAHFAQKLSRHEQKSDKARRNRNSDQL
jgi:23S rRNA pseudouridine1911/1915/1917 synthase